jgi:hypothetical protein
MYILFFCSNNRFIYLKLRKKKKMKEKNCLFKNVNNKE